ncbi:MAG: transposase, partial [Tepidisphaeraceae bacterium]
FKSFLVQSDGHLLTVLRYVEANPLWAKMVTAAQDWPWSSLGRGRQEAKLPVQLTGWPVDRPGDWLTIVNAPLEEETVESLRTSVSRGRPFGKLGWVNRMVKRLGLESTVRDPWRPRKKKRRRARK